MLGQYGNPLNKHVRHYEGLSYDADSLHQKHQRAKRAVSHEDQFLRLDFHAHGRHFNLRMKRDMSLFSDDFKLEMSNKVLDYDTSHIYTGHIYGEQGSFTHGSVIDGRFEGFIRTQAGTFYIEPAERYIKDRALPFHSVMYHEDDIRYPHKYGPQAVAGADHSVFEKNEEVPNDWGRKRLQTRNLQKNLPPTLPERLRRKRATQARGTRASSISRRTTLFFRYYAASREAVDLIAELLMVTAASTACLLKGPASVRLGQP
uniref:Disintegrin and metalloproteinase domain-containing protein 10 n=1 Tax=Sphaerodactylus townsendi TaxID=933632 RepID=A0ACB8E5A6_9SAUR